MSSNLTYHILGDFSLLTCGRLMVQRKKIVRVDIFW